MFQNLVLQKALERNMLAAGMIAYILQPLLAMHFVLKRYCAPAISLQLKLLLITGEVVG